MVITKIEQQKKRDTRCNLYVDDEFYAGLTMESVLSSRIYCGKEISKEELDEIIMLSEKQTALNKAVKYISKCMKTKREVVKYLKGKGYEDYAIDYAIDKLGEYNFVDDELYSDLYIKQSSKQKGKKRIEFELKNKGVPEKVIKEKIDNITTDRDSAMEIAKKYIEKNKVNEKTYEKLNRYLSYRGFEYEDIRFVLKTLLKGEDYESRD